MDPNNPPLPNEANLLVWGIMFGVLVVAAGVLAFFNRER